MLRNGRYKLLRSYSHGKANLEHLQRRVTRERLVSTLFVVFVVLSLIYFVLC